MSEDYYKLLCVTPDSSNQDLKKSYRNLARIFHPDKNQQDEGAAEKFKQLNIAYSTLSDPSRRLVYDLFGQEGDSFQLDFEEKNMKWNDLETQESKKNRRRSRSRNNKKKPSEKVS